MLLECLFFPKTDLLDSDMPQALSESQVKVSLHFDAGS